VRTDPWTVQRPISESATARLAEAWDVGVVVFGRDREVESANARARELLNAESAQALADRLDGLERLRLDTMGHDGAIATGVYLALPDQRALRVQMCEVGGADPAQGPSRVLLLQDAGLIAAVECVLQQASHYRCSASLARDWAHDLKGILHNIRINHALLARVVERDGGTADATVRRKYLDSIAREVTRLDRSIELVFQTKAAGPESKFDAGIMCEGLVQLVSGRASRQRVEVVLGLTGGSTEVIGSEDQLAGAVLNLIINALDAMPDQGKLQVSVHGGPVVKIRISDSGPGIPPEVRRRLWQPHCDREPGGVGIGLHATRSVVEAHGGRIDCMPNRPCGTCVEIDLPSAVAI